MRYLGMDVHVASTVWHPLDSEGRTVDKGRVRTTSDALAALVLRLKKEGELLAGQEVGKMSYFVHDVMKKPDVELMSFNAQHLRSVGYKEKQNLPFSNH